MGSFRDTTRHSMGGHEYLVMEDTMGHELYVTVDTMETSGRTHHSCDGRHMEARWDGDEGHRWDMACM